MRLRVGETKIVIGFGEEIGTGDIPKKINPMIEGITSGSVNCDGIFILRNPENCNIINFSFKEIPIYLIKKLKNNYDICSDFLGIQKKDNIKEIVDNQVYKIGNLEIVSFIVDPSNFNTNILYIKDSARKINSSLWRF